MKEKFYSVCGEALDSNGQTHIITVVGKLVTDKEDKEMKVPMTVELNANKTAQGKLTFTKKVLRRTLTVGTAICSPDDQYSKEKGEAIAKRRIKNGDDAGVLTTNSVTMLTDDQVYAELYAKLRWLTIHIDEITGTPTDLSSDDDVELKFDIESFNEFLEKACCPISPAHGKIPTHSPYDIMIDGLMFGY